jgi:hypothetical protein
MKVRDTDVLLPTTLVGACPRQVFMQGPVFGAGVNDKEYPNYRTRELYRAAVALTVKDQEDVGIDVVTDGAQHYENETDWELAELFHTMPHHLDGYVPYGDDVVLGTNTLAVYKPTVVGEVGLPHAGDRARRATGAVHGLRAVVGAPDRGPREARERGEGRGELVRAELEGC